MHIPETFGLGDRFIWVFIGGYGIKIFLNELRIILNKLLYKVSHDRTLKLCLLILRYWCGDIIFSSTFDAISNYNLRWNGRYQIIHLLDDIQVTLRYNDLILILHSDSLVKCICVLLQQTSRVLFLIEAFVEYPITHAVTLDR